MVINVNLKHPNAYSSSPKYLNVAQSVSGQTTQEFSEEKEQPYNNRKHICDGHQDEKQRHPHGRVDVVSDRPIQVRFVIVVVKPDSLCSRDKLIRGKDSVGEPGNRQDAPSERLAQSEVLSRYVKGQYRPVHPAHCETDTSIDEAARELHGGGIDGHQGGHLPETRHDGCDDGADENVGNDGAAGACIRDGRPASQE